MKNLKQRVMSAGYMFFFVTIGMFWFAGIAVIGLFKRECNCDLQTCVACNGYHGI